MHSAIINVQVVSKKKLCMNKECENDDKENTINDCVNMSNVIKIQKCDVSDGLVIVYQ